MPRYGVLPPLMSILTCPSTAHYAERDLPRLIIFSHDETDIHPLWKQGGEQDHGDGSLQADEAEHAQSLAFIESTLTQLPAYGASCDAAAYASGLGALKQMRARLLLAKAAMHRERSADSAKVRELNSKVGQKNARSDASLKAHIDLVSRRVAETAELKAKIDALLAVIDALPTMGPQNAPRGWRSCAPSAPPAARGGAHSRQPAARSAGRRTRGGGRRRARGSRRARGRRARGAGGDADGETGV